MKQKQPEDLLDDEPDSKNNTPTADKLTFGDALKQALKKEGWSYRELAEHKKLQVSEESVMGWVQNKHSPRSYNRVALYNIFPELKQANLPSAPVENAEITPDTIPTLPSVAQETPATGMPVMRKPVKKASRVKRLLIVVPGILLTVIVGILVYLAAPAIDRFFHHNLENPLPPHAPVLTINTMPTQLAQIAPTFIDTLNSADFLNWTAPQGNANIRACRFTPTGLLAIDRSTWPLALCFEQVLTLTTFALQADLTFPINGNNTQPHGAGMVIAANQPSDGATMYRIRIGSDGTWDIYVITSDPAHQGRLDPCPNLTDATAQSTLHNDYNDPISPYIHQGLGQTNTITVTVTGHFITLYMNGHKLETACDTTPTTGIFGLFSASPNKNEVTEALFTKLKVWKF